MAEWIKTKHKGIRFREHPTRKRGVRKDRYYTIRYKLDGKDREERLGWETEWDKAEAARKEDGKPTGRSLEQEAILRLSELKANKESGQGPLTLEARREEKKLQREAVEAERLAEIQAAKTLDEYWQESYFPAAKRKKKKSSWSKEESHFRLWISPIMGLMPLKNIGIRQWDELVKTLANPPVKGEGAKESGTQSPKPKSQRTQLYVTGTLRRILKHAFERRLIDEAPPSGKRIGVTSPGNNRRLRVISPNEEALIMDELQKHDPHGWRITRFAFLTGCRASEAFHLVWANVDFSRGYVTFPETKNQDSRSLWLSPALIELFESMETGEPDEFVFVKEDGNPYTEAPRSFRAAVDKLELNKGRTQRDRVVFHSIRHTVATRLAAVLGVRELMDVMGWRTVQMAMRYVKSDEAKKARALSMLGTIPQEGKVLPFHGHQV